MTVSGAHYSVEEGVRLDPSSRLQELYRPLHQLAGLVAREEVIAHLMELLCRRYTLQLLTVQELLFELVKRFTGLDERLGAFPIATSKAYARILVRGGGTVHRRANRQTGRDEVGYTG